MHRDSIESAVCFSFYIDPIDGDETDGKIPLPDLRGQEEDRGVVKADLKLQENAEEIL